jgi:hypothetical protein
MPEILQAQPRDPEPIEILKAAIAWAKRAGIRVRIGSFGVSVASTHGPKRWEIDPLERDTGIDPLGAVILWTQPPALDPIEAAAQALGMDAMWVEGLATGLALSPRDSRWMQSKRRHFYMHAFESGVTLRIHVLSFPRHA